MEREKRERERERERERARARARARARVCVSGGGVGKSSEGLCTMAYGRHGFRVEPRWRVRTSDKNVRWGTGVFLRLAGLDLLEKALDLEHLCFLQVL